MKQLRNLSSMLRGALASGLLLGCVLCVPGPAPVAAAEDPALQTLSSIAAAAKDFATAQGLQAGSRRTVEVTALDARLRLPACSSELAVGAAPGARSNLRMTVEVRCPAPAWRIYVPVVIKAYDAAVVATRALPRGKILAAEDLVVVESDVSALPAGYARTVESLLGRRLTRPLATGTVFAAGAVFVEPTVRRGQTVTVLAQAGGFAVRMQGVALAAGGVDERIRIKNLSSGREIEGVIRSDSLVEVPIR